ncbi:hypothetical protein C8R43DRAFT_1164755 [Mycena crocata]|nr:hypothetical protein C8R43DRAFT_1164755 [Mycena crocata]
MAVRSFSPMSIDPRDTTLDNFLAKRREAPIAESSNDDYSVGDSSEDEGVSLPHCQMHRRKVNHEQRALIRVLIRRHGIPPAVVASHLDLKISLINKTLNNGYIPKDDIKKDKNMLPDNFLYILDQVIDKKNEASESRKSKRLAHRSVKEQQKQDSAAEPRKPSPCTSISTQSTNTQAHSSNSQSVSHAASSIPVPLKAVSDEAFLRAFIASIPLQPVWVTVFKSAGFTAEKLRRMAGSSTQDVVVFLGNAFPEMEVSDRFFFVKALNGLAIPM